MAGYPLHKSFGLITTHENIIDSLAQLNSADLCALIGQVICSHQGDDDLAEKLGMYCEEFVRTEQWPEPEAF